MAPISQQIAEMVDILPDADQALAYEVVKRMVLAWDPDFTKVTPAEAEAIARAEDEIARGETVPMEAINWD